MDLLRDKSHSNFFIADINKKILKEMQENTH